MLDLALYDRIRLREKPPVQRFIADRFLRFDYRRVRIDVEGLENLPERRVVYAMNHTDNFNYWPFQYEMHRRFERYTATWVKGKNWEHPAVATFMRLTNNIPIASRGYLITRDFSTVTKRRPKKEEYRALREAVDAGALLQAEVPRAILERPRDMLGRPFDPTRESYVEAMNALFREMMRRFVELNRFALSHGLDVLVFPQGTRSIRLSRGHIGLAELALHLGAPIVPVGCNGCDLVYPGRSVISKPGHIVYRIGEPFAPEDFADVAPKGPFVPFSLESESEHRGAFQAVVDRVMERLDGLLDERHRFSRDRASDGTRGTDRFL
jgi:1-acyl-sn-glycerol-3-phosphate acyltransferase